MPGSHRATASVEFTDARAGNRTVTLPIRAALPVLAKARDDAAAHPSVALLAAASLLAMRFVAAGKFEPGDGCVAARPARAGRRPAPPAAGRVPGLRRAGRRRRRGRRTPRGRRGGRLPCRGRLPLARSDASSTRSDPYRGAPEATTTSRAGSRPWSAATARPPSCRSWSGLSLRVEADEEELVAGAVPAGAPGPRRAGPAAPAATQPALWTDPTGRPRVRRPGPDPRRHRAAGGGRGLAGPRPAARAAGARRDHPRRRRAGEPARATASRPWRRGGVDVLWPRSLGRDLTATAVAGPRSDGPEAGARGPAPERRARAREAVFGFRWQLALHGEPLTDEEMDQPRRRGVAPAAAARRLDGRRPRDRPQGAASGWSAPSRRPRPIAAALTGAVEVDRDAAGRGAGMVGASLLRVRERLLRRRPRSRRRPARRAAGDAARLPAAGPDLAGRAHLPRPRRLPGRRHGAGQDRHPDRAAPAPRRSGSPRADAGGLPGQPAGQLGGRDPPLRARGRRSAASTAGSRSLDGLADRAHARRASC